MLWTKRQEQIYKTAARLFSVQGYHGTTIRLLSKEIGVEPGLLYHYYKNKNDLFFNVIKKGLQELSEDVEDALKYTVTPHEQMCAALTTHISYVLKKNGEESLASEIRYLEPEQLAKVRKIFRVYALKFELILSQGIKQGVFQPCHVEFITLLVLSNANTIAMWYRAHGTLKEDEVISWYVDYAMNSLHCENANAWLAFNIKTRQYDYTRQLGLT